MDSGNPAPGFQEKPDHQLTYEVYAGEITVSLGETILATTKSAICAKEANYPEVFYIPRSDVNMTTLEATDTTSFCPFKGTAKYWKPNAATSNASDNLDICWSYEDPFDEAGAIGSYIAFYADRVTVTSS